ncbi:MAG: AAA family ATPase [Polyangiaceae bacterium]
MLPIRLPGYEISPQPLYESRNSIVVRGRRRADGQAVVVKLLNAEYPTPARAARFRRELQITQALAGEHVIHAFELFEWERSLGMVLEDLGAESLERQGKPSIEVFFEVALSLCDALGHVHRAGFIHKDVNPSNVVRNRTTGQLKLIDFGIATALSRETLEARRPELLEGTLLYISPEQTGRMNRGVDYRTDLYALGATLYALLAGRAPFVSEDPLEIVHGHLALAPPPLHEIAAEVPRSVSAVVHKLLAKEPDARYQSAAGLARDLVRCRAEIAGGSGGAVFALGAEDVSDRFRVSEKLFGREREVGQLLSAFERCAGGVELLGLPGPPGIGKSALVAEVHRPITGRRGFFAQGKFDLLHRDVPFAAVIQAFRGLLRQILAQGEAQLAAWGAEVREALGANARAVVDVVPELGMILGETEPLAEASSLEAQHRFNLAFQKFVQVLAQGDHPLVLFLDDLQWADPPSLKLVEQLVTGAGVHHLLVLGAWRDGEVDAAHPLSRTLAEIDKRGRAVEMVRVGPLAEEDVARLVADTLRREVDDVRDLAKLAAQKTGGNPFFLGQVLRTLHADGHLPFDARVRGFVFDPAAIRRVEITENVVELMAGKIRRMPEGTQRVLRRAACIGNRFDLGVLALIYGASDAEGGARRSLADALWPALEQGLVAPVDGAYKFVDDADTTALVEYRFVHDRVQQAAYESIPEEGRGLIHLEIGRVLLRHTAGDAAARAEHLFDMAGHFLQARGLITEAEERARVGQLLHEAGRRAMASAAFAPAWRYLRTAIGLAGKALWEEYERALELLHLAGDAALLANDFEAMEGLVDEVLARARTPLDRARAHETRLTARMIRSRMSDAVAVGRALLGELGLSYPANPGLPHLLAGVAKTRFALRGRRAAEVGIAHAQIDPVHRARMRGLMFVSPAAYAAAPMLLPLMVLDYILLTMRAGIVPESVYGFAAYGFLLAGHLGDFRRGLEFADRALELCELPENKRVHTRTVLVSHWFVLHWSRPLRDSIEPLLGAWRSGLETGDVEFGAYSCNSRVVYRILTGDPLEEVVAEAAGFADACRRLDSAPGERRVRLFMQLAHHLMGRERDSSAIRGEVFDAPEEACTADPILGSFVRSCELWLFTLLRRYDDATLASERLAKQKEPILGSPMVPLWRFHSALVECALLPKRTGLARVEARLRVEGHLRALRKWADNDASNRLHQVYLVEAELARVTGSPERAAARYDLAIEQARRQRFDNDEALACELAGEHHLARGRVRVAGAYLRDARHLWQKWGAQALVDALDARHSSLVLGGGTRDAATTTVPTTYTPVSETHSGATAGALDLGTVLKASEALAGEIELGAMLGRVMRVTLENAGARRGVLVLSRDGVPFMEVEQRAGADEAPHMLRGALPATGSEDAPLPVSMVRYALRTGEAAVLDDARKEDGRFSFDPYVKAKRTRAALALPLMKQGRAIGVLYLENELTAGVFGPDRLGLLRVLASQAAMSLENALLYEGLERALSAQIEMTQANERFVPREFLAALGRGSIAAVSLGDSVQKEMTVLYSDMRAFTSHVEGQKPGENIAFINDYLSEMEPAILEEGGFVDSYVGDAILALFDVAPLRAVRAGVGMLVRLRRYNARRAERGLSTVRIGVGLNTGVLTLGTMGGPQRLKCGVIGDSVNLTARIEALTKRYGAPLLVSDDTMSRLPADHGLAHREVDRVRVVGRQRPVTLYEVFEAEGDAVRGARAAAAEDWGLALRAYEARELSEAMERFRRVQALLPGDSVVALRMERCARYLESPPAADWDGVENLTRK